MSIVILVGASKKIGLGHLNRCSMLGNCLKQTGLAIQLYILRDNSSKDQNDLNELIVSYDELYQKSLRDKLQVIIFDMPIKELRLDFIREIKKLGIESIIIDDDGELDNKNLRSILISCSAKFLSVDLSSRGKGPNYILLNPSFREVRDRGKQIRHDLRKILLSFGGSDPNHITSSVLSILNEIYDCKFDITIILGRLSDDLPRNLLRTHHCVNVLRNVSNMSEQLFETDLALLSGGMTMYEACCIGTPSVIVNQNQQQDQEASYLHQHGCVINAGMHNQLSKYVLEKVLLELRDKSIRTQLSQRAKQLVDGEGLVRVTDIIKDVLK